MPTIITEGAASARGFGFGGSGGSAQAAAYIEDVFSTYLYTGNGSTQTITNGIDLAGKGGLVWFKARSAADPHALVDTVRGTRYTLASSSTAAQVDQGAATITGLSNGFSINGGYSNINSVREFASWTFREQPKFFDIVTYTGTGANRTIAHNLGSAPGCIIVKRTDATGDWQVYHSGLTSAAYSIQLNLTDGQASAPTIWNSTAPTSSVFSVGTDTTVNASGGTYVAYIYASNAGGFGAAGTDNAITCGTFTENNANNITVNTGYEPQYVMFKCADAASPWYIVDSMRGISTPTSGTATGNYIPTVLQADYAGAETSANAISLTSTGFIWYQNGRLTNTAEWIYIAIRRGPMKTPTSGTSVYSPIAVNAATGTVQTTNFVVDSQWKAIRSSSDSLNTSVDDRLRGVSTTTTASGNYLITSGTLAEATASATTQAWNNTGFQIPTYYGSVSDIFWSFGRAPGFFDVVCYTGNGVSGRTVTHNLGVAPELIIVKKRSSVSAVVGWPVWCVNGYPGFNNWWVALNLTNGRDVYNGFWTSAGPSPTSTTFTVGNDPDVNGSASTYVAYLFASCPGVSKVGSYSGTSATQTINCGFTGGARFVLIKRTNSTGDWYVWDTARGMVSGTDPSLLLNSTAAEVNANSVYTTGVGFQIVSTAAGINASGGTYIYLAIA
jgi:hypothetical protein